jgi:hypothetical protein
MIRLQPRLGDMDLLYYRMLIFPTWTTRPLNITVTASITILAIVHLALCVIGLSPRQGLDVWYAGAFVSYRNKDRSRCRLGLAVWSHAVSAQCGATQDVESGGGFFDLPLRVQRYDGLGWRA